MGLKAPWYGCGFLSDTLERHGSTRRQTCNERRETSPTADIRH